MSKRPKELAGDSSESVNEGSIVQPHKKPSVDRLTARRRQKTREMLEAPQGFLIRISEEEDMKRAIVVLGEVRRPYCGFTDHQLLITPEHLDILQKNEIPFEMLS